VARHRIRLLRTQEAACQLAAGWPEQFRVLALRRIVGVYPCICRFVPGWTAP